MTESCRIVPALPQHVGSLAAIERSAAALLAGHAPDALLDEVTAETELVEACAAGRLWVALAGEVPVGFACVTLLAADLPHLQEMDVASAHGRRGIGTALLRAVCDWFQRSAYRELTLTTFRDVPWNMPFYARHGFEEVPGSELRPELVRVLADETRRGLDPSRRVVMRLTAPR